MLGASDRNDVPVVIEIGQVSASEPSVVVEGLSGSCLVVQISGTRHRSFDVDFPNLARLEHCPLWVADLDFGCGC